MKSLLAQVDAMVPGSQDELYLVQAIAIIAFGLLAVLMGYVHTGQFDLYRVLRNGIGGGAGFPPAILLFLYPVSDRAQALFGAESIKVPLMLGGATTALLILYGLFKK